MSDRIFQTAYDRLRARLSNDEWLAMTPRQITDAIYLEIRAIDAERSDMRQQGTETTA